MAYRIARKALFRMDAERAHDLAKEFLKLARPVIPDLTVKDERLHQEAFGLAFRNPILLAAGFDKDAELVRVMEKLGFGGVEIGTVTPLQQKGNPKPRIWRYPKQESLRNAMGFNGKGHENARKNLSGYPDTFNIPIGANIGKNKDTPLEDAKSDYIKGINAFKDLSDFIVINISSPNTPMLRDLQNDEFAFDICKEAKGLSGKPVLLKIAPDMTEEQALDICHAAIRGGADGIIATNTTVDYSLIPGVTGPGGLSGKVLTKRSYEMLEALSAELFGITTLISVGGIFTPDDILRRIKAGSALVEIFTAFPYKGPTVARSMCKGLLKLLEKEGFANVAEATGAKRA